MPGCGARSIPLRPADTRGGHAFGCYGQSVATPQQCLFEDVGGHGGGGVVLAVLYESDAAQHAHGLFGDTDMQIGLRQAHAHHQAKKAPEPVGSTAKPPRAAGGREAVGTNTKSTSSGLFRVFRSRNLGSKIWANRQQIHAPGIGYAIAAPLRNGLRRHATKPRHLCGSAQLVDQKYGLWIAHVRYGNHSYRDNANHSYEEPCNASGMERINDRIKRLRDQAGMSQGALARAVGVTRPAVSKWENGDTENLKLSNLIKLCQIFRLTADELIGGDLALERPAAAVQHAINEPAASYKATPRYQMPDRLGALYETLSDEGQRLVDAHLEVAIETAIRMYGHRAAAQQNAA